MWVEVDAMPGIKIVKTGTIDDEDALKNATPALEMYCKDRPGSIGELTGIEHKLAA